MPILAVDQNGRIYQTSPDRADGKGYGSSPECVNEGDLTLGSAYLKSQKAQREEVLRQRRAQEILDREDEIARYNAKLRRRQQSRRNQHEAEAALNQDSQQALIKRSMMNGCTCAEPVVTSMSGNGLSHNGRQGWDGMSRDQKTIHHALTGQGSNTAYFSDPIEVEQMRQKAEAERILRLKARR